VSAVKISSGGHRGQRGVSSKHAWVFCSGMRKKAEAYWRELGQSLFEEKNRKKSDAQKF
jgi:hypothetical protein